ncbi:MAG: DUF2203 family protein [Candidatus Omnitrophota bacterium]|jgi:hypothetical protein|nr:MAG: DUF2203 family protein [Candidatus Omnitrophota bacterium]
MEFGQIDMPHFDKHFTYVEANALIPRMREIFLQIGSLIEETRKSLNFPVLQAETFTPGRSNGKQKFPPLDREEILKQINDLITEVTDQGIVVQDITRGLIDFPSFIEGEEVFLCYELNDGDAIKYYHGLNNGYAGRKPIPSSWQ